MRTQYGRKSISRRSVIAAVSVAAFVEVACGSTNVFNDAVFWFRGGKDCVAADGKMRTGEFFDDLHADNTSHDNHKLTVDGYAENGVFQTEEVVFPATGQKKNMQVLHISNVQKDGNRFPLRVRPRSLFANNNISNEYTIVTRVRLDRATSNDWLFRIGYSTARGLLLGFEALSANPGFKQIYGYRFKANDTSSSTFRLNTLVVPTNTWFDLSLAVGNGYARVGIAVPTFSDNNPAIAFQSAAVDTDSLTVLGENYYRFFGETTATSASSPGNTSGFLGSVQQLAVWGRRLSDQEVMSAFGMPRPAIFRIGLANGASNEFGGTRSGASQTIDGLGSWQDVSNTMLAGDTWTVNFNALRDEAGLPQIFSIRSLESSDAASLQASLNGTSLGSRFISANGRGFWAVPENLVVSGANTLTIRRTDGAAGAFLVDSMELGGSIGAGEAGYNTADLCPPLKVKGIPSSADPNPNHWPRELLTYNDATNIQFRVWVDPDVAPRCTHSLLMRTRGVPKTDSSNPSSDQVFTIYVNGAEKLVHNYVNKAWRDHAIDFGAGELRTGWNTIAMRTAPYDNCYWMIDYYRFKTVLDRGFSIPPPGFMLIVK